jgi:hypothetical protein
MPRPCEEVFVYIVRWRDGEWQDYEATPVTNAARATGMARELVRSGKHEVRIGVEDMDDVHRKRIDDARRQAKAARSIASGRS